MPVEPQWREELQGHRGDPFAHGAMAERFMRENQEHLRELELRQQAVTERLTTLEKFQQRMVGGLIVIGSLVGGGLIDYIGHVNRWW